MRATQARREEGFTLIELLMAVTLAVFLLGGIGTAFVSAMNGSQGVHERMLQSHDAQTLATYFTSDVQSADPLLMDASAVNAVTPTGCAGSSPGENLLRLQWTETNGEASRTAFSVSYRVTPPDAATDPARLTRYYCAGTGTPVAGVMPAASAILSTATATTHKVASRLAYPVPAATLTGSKISVTLNSFEDADSDAFAFTLSAYMRTKVNVAYTFTATPSTTTPVAGAGFNVVLKATTDGTTVDTTYAGAKTLTYSGPGSSPNGTAATYQSVVTFASGTATVPVTLYNAESKTLSISEGLRTGSTTLTVSPGTATLALSTCPPDTKISTPTTMTVGRGVDSWGNAAATSSAVTVNLTGAGTYTTPVTIPASSASSTFSYTTPGTSGTSVTLAAVATGYTSTSCAFTTTNPVFLVTSPGPLTAGAPFDLTVTASANGTTADTSYSGTKTIMFSGPGNAPSGTGPSYPTTVNFVNGVGTATGIKLYRAQTVSLAATEGSRTGSTSVTVAHAPTTALKFSTCPPDTKKKKATTETISVTDAYGNAKSTSTTVTLSATNGGTFAPNSVTVPAGGTITSAYGNPDASGVSITMTATATGVTSGSCGPFTTTN